MRKLVAVKEKKHVMNISFRKGFVGTNNKPTSRRGKRKMMEKRTLYRSTMKHS